MKVHTAETQASLTPTRALELLKEGNQRFIKNLKANRDLLEQANETKDSQWPFAVILSCIDSRTSAELIFDQGLGDIFSVRIAGNIVNSDILGSIEYGCKVEGSKLVVVLGHTTCGAVKGACDQVELGHVTQLLQKIQPSVNDEKTVTDKELRNSKNPDFVQKVIIKNIRRSVKNIIDRSRVIYNMIEKGEAGIVGALHDLESGEVTFYDDTFLQSKEDIERLKEGRANLIR